MVIPAPLGKTPGSHFSIESFSLSTRSPTSWRTTVALKVFVKPPIRDRSATRIGVSGARLPYPLE